MELPVFIKQLKRDLEAQESTLIAYTKRKLETGDYHGVQDAASDLRDIDAKLELLRAIEDFCLTKRP